MMSGNDWIQIKACAFVGECGAVPGALEILNRDRGRHFRSRRTQTMSRRFRAHSGKRVEGLLSTKIVWLLSSSAAQISAACWNAMSRCWPRVVPVLPPTGTAGVGSLNPSPGPSALMISMVAAADALLASARRQMSAAIYGFMVVCLYCWGVDSSRPRKATASSSVITQRTSVVPSSFALPKNDAAEAAIEAHRLHAVLVLRHGEPFGRPIRQRGEMVHQGLCLDIGWLAQFPAGLIEDDLLRRNILFPFLAAAGAFCSADCEKARLVAPTSITIAARTRATRSRFTRVSWFSISISFWWRE